MVNALFDVFSAWNALLYIIAGASLSGFGLLVAGYTFYVRATERAYTGQIVSMRTEDPGKNMYWPVVAYTDAQGARHEALANSGSSLIGGNVPGKKVTVFAAPSAPDALMIARDLWILLALGLFLLAVGSPFIAVGFEMLHFNFRTALVALALAGYAGFKLFRLVHPFLDARKAGGWAAAREAFMARAAQRQAMQPVSAAEIATVSVTQEKRFASALPLSVIVGAALLIGGGVWFERTSAFLSAAIAADGVVLRNAESESDGKTTYNAVVEFTDSTERRITFHDSVGTSPPSFSTGDKVRVLYLRQDESRAMLDRGMWNWLVPLLIAGFGGLLLSCGACGYASRRPDASPSLSSRAETRDPAASA